MQTRGVDKRKTWLKKIAPKWDNLRPFSTIRRLRCELACTEALLAEANRKLRAGGRTAAQNHRIKVMAKAAEIRGV